MLPVQAPWHRCTHASERSLALAKWYRVPNGGRHGEFPIELRGIRVASGRAHSSAAIRTWFVVEDIGRENAVLGQQDHANRIGPVDAYREDVAAAGSSAESAAV